MLDLRECKEILGDNELTDEQVLQLRDSLYALTETVLDNYFENHDTEF